MGFRGSCGGDGESTGFDSVGAIFACGCTCFGADCRGAGGGRDCVGVEDG
jgi:hypothetical protein